MRIQSNNKVGKGIFEEGNFIERTYLTNKEFEMLPLVKMPLNLERLRIRNEGSTMQSLRGQR